MPTPLPNTKLFVQANFHGQSFPAPVEGTAWMGVATHDHLFTHNGVDFYPPYEIIPGLNAAPKCVPHPLAGQKHHRGDQLSVRLLEKYVKYYYKNKMPVGSPFTVNNELPILTIEQFDQCVNKVRTHMPVGTPIGAYVHTGCNGLYWEMVMEAGPCDYVHLNVSAATTTGELDEWANFAYGVRLNRPVVFQHEPGSTDIAQRERQKSNMLYLNARHPDSRHMLFLARAFGDAEREIVVNFGKELAG
jgi:hypothetical protein